jgi:uncharacterized protein YkwD
MRSGRWPLAVIILGAGLSWAAADAKKDEVKLSKEEQRILDLTNEARAKDKLPALKVNATLLEVARAHSANMAKQHAMKHTLDGKNPAQRVEKAGYDYRAAGENIATGDKGASAEALFQGWMDSKPHHENIMSPKYEEIGIGLATDDKGQVYATQVFASPHLKKR